MLFPVIVLLPYFAGCRCINIGALVGGVVVPLWVQQNVTVAYMLPVGMLTASVMVFLASSPRYVKNKPNWTTDYDRNLHNHHKSNTTNLNLCTIFRICLLILPFTIAYSQMATTFIVQGTVMKKAFCNLIDAACM